MQNISNENRSRQLELEKTTKPVNYDEEEDEHSTRLPPEMVECIISMIPYPDILKAKMLSKKWNSKLSNTTDAEDEGFHEMVISNCIKWPIFFPYAFDDSSIFLAGFNHLTGTWLKMSFHLPWLTTTKILNSTRFNCRKKQPTKEIMITGIDSLICCPLNFRQTEIVVLNIFTRNYKWLPPRPNVANCKESVLVSKIHMFRDGYVNYKILTMRLVVKNVAPNGWIHQICTQLYESKSNSWTTKLSDFQTATSAFAHCTGVYLNGSMYFIEHDTISGFFELWAYNVEKATWHEMQMPQPLVSAHHKFQSANLLVSRERLMLILHRICPGVDEDGSTSPTIRENSFSLFEIQSLTETVTEIYRGPPEPIPGASGISYICEDDSIFFGHGKQYTKFITEFNISRQVWISHLHFSSPEDGFSSFFSSNFVLQPGKNPFIRV